MSKLIKRADGSYSKRGLWDNIRANKGSGKKPTKQMLEQERKIKKEENMKMEYKKGDKKSIAKEAKREKESFIQESKELKFGAPGVKPPVKKQSGGPITSTPTTKEFVDNVTPKSIRNSNNSDREGISPMKASTAKTAPAPKFPLKKEEMKMGGKKTMEPGGGGRFAKMVNKMKGEGKSEESAKAIAASIGRKKYGKSKFQAMAEAGKKKMGGKKC